MLVCTSCNAVSAEQHSYKLAIKQERKCELLRVYQRPTGRTIWTRRVANHSVISWSHDKRGLAVGVTTLASDTPEILSWREGHTPVQIDYHDDYLVGNIVWSPDDSYVLFRTGMSADSELDLGQLCCLNTLSGKLYTLTQYPNSVRKMVWKDRRKVLYWTGRIC